jgi:ribosomal protein S13
VKLLELDKDKNALSFCKKFRIRVNKRTKALSEEEIDELVTSASRKRIFKILCKLKHILDFINNYWWEIVICYKDRSYKIGIFKDKIMDAQYCDLDIDYIVDAGELSQEEIDELLTPIDDKE